MIRAATVALFTFLCVDATVAATVTGVAQTGRFTPDADPPATFFTSPIATGAGFVVVGETSVGELYVHDAATGDRITKLQPSGGSPGNRFGQALAMEGAIAVVGDDGAAFVFDIATGAELRQLTPTTPLPAGSVFGESVAIGDGVALVSAAPPAGGAGLVYAFDVASGAEIATLSAADGAVDNGFGDSLDLDGGLAIVGAISDTEAGADAGAAYLYEIATGNQVVKLLGPGSDSFFGAGVALSDGIAFVGEPAGGGPVSRRIGLYDAASGAELGAIPAGGVLDPSFGSFLAADDGLLLVGSAFDAAQPAAGTGAAYLYDVASRGLIERFTPSDGLAFSEFGFGVALGDGFAAVLAGSSDAAYAFELIPVPEPGAFAIAAPIAAVVALRRQRRATAWENSGRQPF